MKFSASAVVFVLLCSSNWADGDDRRGPSNADEPWVFRTVLDERPRVIVASLGDAAWAAWDTETCRIYQVWRPGLSGVTLTGAVYDDEHGPQPVTDGQRLHEEPGEAAWFVDAGVPVDIRYRGHRFRGSGNVSLAYQFELPGKGTHVAIEESPSLGSGGDAVLVRTFRISGLPPLAKLSLKLSGDASVWSVTGRMAQLKSAGGNTYVTFTGSGEATLIGRWALTK